VRWVSGSGEPRQAFTMACNQSDYWTDYILHHLDESLTRHGFDGFYYDGTLSYRPCRNTHHGCGYADEQGRVQPTYPILTTRRFAKRLYAICKQHGEGNLVDCHTSGNVLPMRAAWVDQLWNGEQYQNKQPGFHLDLDYFRAQCIGTQYGAPSMFLSYDHRPFMLREALSFTLLHDVMVRRSDPTIYRLWQVREAFDTNGATWLPYWKNQQYVRVESDPAGELWDEAGMASLYLHAGERALLVVSNIQNEPAAVKVHAYLPAMGLPDTVAAHDAETDEPVRIADGVIDLQLDAYEYKLIWLE
jgi:hypothetical protein